MYRLLICLLSLTLVCSTEVLRLLFGIFLLGMGSASLAAQPIEEICPGGGDVLSSMKFPLDVPASISAGHVEVEFTVRADGSIVDIVAYSSTDPLFEASTVQAISKLSCLPQPSDLRLRVPMDFKRPLAVTPGICPNFPSVIRTLGYPKDAVVKGLESGEVLIEFKMMADGDIREFYVLRSTHEVFTAEALRGLAQLKCKGVGREVRVRVPFAFRLE